MRRMLGRKDVLPGMIGAIQTHGELVHWHPLYLAEGKIEPEVVENMRTWQHSGLERRPVGVPAGRRPARHRASGAVHDSLSLQFVSLGQGHRNRAGGLQGRETGLPRLSRPAWRRPGIRPQAEFPDPRSAGLLGRVQESTFRPRART